MIRSAALVAVFVLLIPVAVRAADTAAGQAAYRSFPGEPVQGKIDRFTAAEVQEVTRKKHRATRAPVDSGKYA